MLVTFFDSTKLLCDTRWTQGLPSIDFHSTVKRNLPLQLVSIFSHGSRVIGSSTNGRVEGEGLIQVVGFAGSQTATHIKRNLIFFFDRCTQIAAQLYKRLLKCVNRYLFRSKEKKGAMETLKALMTLVTFDDSQ